MANRPIHLFLAVIFLCLASAAAPLQATANDRVEVVKTDIERTNAKFDRIDTENFEVMFPSVGILAIEDFEVGFIANLRVAFHLNERLFIEASYGMSEGDQTSYETISGSTIFTDDDREYKTWDGSLGVNVFPGETWLFGRAFSSDLYAVLGAGRTTFGDRSWSTINVGAGYRLFISDWLALRLDLRDHIFNRNLFNDDKRTHNIELSLGLSYFF